VACTFAFSAAAAHAERRCVWLSFRACLVLGLAAAAYAVCSWQWAVKQSLLQQASSCNHTEVWAASGLSHAWRSCVGGLLFNACVCSAHSSARGHTGAGVCYWDLQSLQLQQRSVGHTVSLSVLCQHQAATCLLLPVFNATYRDCTCRCLRRWLCCSSLQLCSVVLATGRGLYRLAAAGRIWQGLLGYQPIVWLL
jgi:hypothetical protein